MDYIWKKNNQMLQIDFKTNVHPPAQLHDSCIFTAVEIELTQESVFHIVQHVTVDGIGRTLSLQLKHQHTAVMT